MGLLNRLFGGKSVEKLPGETTGNGVTEQGHRATPENSLVYQYRQDMEVDYALRATIMDIRTMDRADGRVKKIHKRTARQAAKGGLKLKAPSSAKRLHREFGIFCKRLHLNRRDKLESDIRGLMMEGNLPIQWVLDGDGQLVSCVRMPTETLVPRVGPNGRFKNVLRAYDQVDLNSHQVIAQFPLYQLSVARLQPDNYDDWGCLGRPYLDATRSVWKQLRMTEEDLVIRRRMRAPLRMVHTLEGATEPELEAYKTTVEGDQSLGNYRDYYINKKGGVASVQGDSNLDQIADIGHLLDTFFAGSPAPKGLFGYTGELQRDILEDLRRDYFDELDSLQDNVAFVYELGFRLHLLLSGINPEAPAFQVQFAERRTDTANQRADLALKYQAMGLAPESTWTAAGLDVPTVRAELDTYNKSRNPYPDPDNIDAGPNTAPRVSVTPSNQRKGESATTISTRS